ncbi:hypothetical protein BJX62DRAFT_213562 [Aspergillus germanicus]
MSMILRMRNISVGLCPWCRSSSRGDPEGPIECDNCGRVYHRVEELNEIEVCDGSPVVESHRRLVTWNRAARTKPRSQPSDPGLGLDCPNVATARRM